MKKWFQVYIEPDDPNSDYIPMRMDPDTIQGFVKYTNYITLVYTPYGQFKVHEEYEKFTKRLFVFVNFDTIENTQPQEEIETTTTRKKYIIKIKKEQKDLEALQDYYDNHQPDNNSGKYV